MPLSTSPRQRLLLLLNCRHFHRSLRRPDDLRLTSALRLLHTAAAASASSAPPLLASPAWHPWGQQAAAVRSVVRALHCAANLRCEQKQSGQQEQQNQQQQQQEQQEQGKSSGDGKDKGLNILLLAVILTVALEYLLAMEQNRLTGAIRSVPSPRLLISWQDARWLLAAGEVSELILRRDIGVAQLLLHPGALLEDGQALDPDTSVLLCLTRHCAEATGRHLGLSQPAMSDFLAKAHFFHASSPRDASTEFKRALSQLESQLMVRDADRVSLQEHTAPSGGYPVVAIVALLLLLLRLITKGKSPSLTKPSSAGGAAQKKRGNGNGNPLNIDVRSMMDPFDFKVASQNTSTVRFKDVAGLHEAKQELEEFVNYLKDPKKFQTLGARLPHGALLLGPPGCGKTLLVKALANEASVPFFYMAGPEFVEMIGGLGASRVRRLFSQARESAPCIIFIDELDAIGRKRSASNFSDGGGEMDQTLNQLLVEMDGMDTTVGVICFAATNRSEVLDSALLRPGRFDRHILIDLPTLIERQEMFSLYLGQYRLAELPDHFNKRLAALTPGRSGADIANICNEAALIAARSSKPAVEAADFEGALERAAAAQQAAPRRLTPTTAEERERTAYSEAGKALVAWLLETPPPMIRLSIVPRRLGTGGPQRLASDRKLYTREALIEAIACLLAGRAAETVAFNTVSSASHEDQRAATNLAYRLVRELGMSDRIGHLSFNDAESSESAPVRPYSRRTEALFDSEAQATLGRAFRLARDVLTGNRDRLDRLAKALLEKEELGYEQLLELLGQSPHPKPGLAEITDWAKG